jgi:hypothetical protein
MDGRGYLEKLITDSLRGGSPNQFEIRGVAIGLVAAGALAQEEADRILADLDATLRATGRFKVVRSSMSTPAGTPVAVRAGTVRPEWCQAINDPDVPVLRYVVPLAGRAITVGDTTGSVISLEVWSTSVTLNLTYAGLPRDGPRDPVDTAVRWRGWDDAGTQYRSSGFSSSGSSTLLNMRRRFDPGPPDHARLLTLVADHPDGRATLAIELGQSS